MFSPTSFKAASFLPVSWSGLGAGVLTPSEWLIRARRRHRR